jgi:hypothetical protein
VQSGSIPKQHIRNKIGDIITYTGSKPDFLSPTPINPQVIQYLQMLKQEAYNIVGISMLSARSEKPAGLSSGKALQTYNDIESERFQLLGQAYEEFHVDAFRIITSLCARESKQNRDFSVVTTTGQGMSRENWLDISLDQDAYIVQPYPVSALPQEPAARFEFLTQQMQAGLISPEEFSELNDMPDLKASAQMKYASYYATKDNIERILDGLPYISPEKFDNLEQMLMMVTNAYLSSRKNPAIPDSVLDAFRVYLEDIQTLIDAIKPPAPEVAPEAVGQPMPQPTNELLPVAPQE